MIRSLAKEFGVLARLSHFFLGNCKISLSYGIAEMMDFSDIFAFLLDFAEKLTRKSFKIVY